MNSSMAWLVFSFVAALAALAIYSATVRKGQVDDPEKEAPVGGNIITVASEILDLYRVVLVFVRSAERLGGSTGAEKLNWVIGQVKGLDDYFDLSPDWLRKIIESAVEEIKPQATQELSSLPADFPGDWEVSKKENA